MLLAGDIGGTKTLLALFEMDGDRPAPRLLRRYASADHPGLGEVVGAFLAEAGARVDRAAFGVAGPVVEGESRITNLPWIIRAEELSQQHGIDRVALINDFAAVGHGLQVVPPQDLLTLQEGRRDRSGTIAVIGAGTGLGEGFLVSVDGRYRVFSSEGGHADLAPRTPEEWALRQFIAQDVGGRVAVEHAVCGKGLERIYRFLTGPGGMARLPTTTARLAQVDPNAAVSELGLAGADPACARALDLFLGLFGAEAGNLALRVLATGGVYVAGGIAPKLASRMGDGIFMDAFLDKGDARRPDLSRMPVQVVLDENVGLLGAAVVASRL